MPSYARVSTYRFPPEDIDMAPGQFQQAISEIEEMQEAVLLLDRSSGKAMTITYWESEETLSASREAANQARSRAASAAGGSIESVEEFEVALKESPALRA